VDSPVLGGPDGSRSSVNLPKSLIALLHQPSICFLTTLMPDGSPQITQTWVDTDGEHVVINTVQGFQKVKNVERDPRVAVAVADPSGPSRYYAIRGRVVNVTTEGGAEHIDALAQRYLGAPYPWYGGRAQVRVILTISADKINGMG
jgi:PPOX class probable F420-dependent enzyme